MSNLCSGGRYCGTLSTQLSAVVIKSSCSPVFVLPHSTDRWRKRIYDFSASKSGISLPEELTLQAYGLTYQHYAEGFGSHIGKQANRNLFQNPLYMFNITPNHLTVNLARFTLFVYIQADALHWPLSCVRLSRTPMMARMQSSTAFPTLLLLQ